jgi:hypothetical protein
MISGPTEPRGIISLRYHGGNKGENRTVRDFKLWRELNRLPDLIFAIRGRIVQEALKMEDENGWKRLEKHLLVRLARAGISDSHGLRQ